MNGKPDWFLRLVLVAILLVLAAHVTVEFLKFKSDAVNGPVGRYVQHPSEHSFMILDTRTGTFYALDPETKSVMEGNIVELAKKQKK
jgi:hypothetical protein